MAYVLAVFVISSIYFFIIKSSYDFKTKKFKIVDIWSVLIWALLLLLMSIGGGIIGWIFLATSFLLLAVQLLLRFCILFKKISGQQSD